jgi:hypothetical protein
MLPVERSNTEITFDFDQNNTKKLSAGIMLLIVIQQQD